MLIVVVYLICAQKMTVNADSDIRQRRFELTMSDACLNAPGSTITIPNETQCSLLCLEDPVCLSYDIKGKYHNL